MIAEVDEPPPDTFLDQGKWVVESGVDPMSDEPTFIAALKADTGGAGARLPMLFVRCKKQSSEVLIAWNTYLSDNTLVTVRFGNGKPRTFKWDPSTDESATFLDTPNKVWFFSSAMNVETIAAQIEPYRSGPVTAVFDVRGMAKVFSESKSLCGISEE